MPQLELVAAASMGATFLTVRIPNIFADMNLPLAHPP